MHIGFDLDGIFVATPPFIPKKVIEWLYRGHDQKFFYRFPTRAEQAVRVITHMPILRPLMQKNIDILKKKKKTGHAYYLISSRFGFLRARTHAIITTHKLSEVFDMMYFNFDNAQPHLFKDAVIKKLAISRYIDDDLPLLQFLAKQNSRILFYWLNSKEKKEIEKNLFAITDLRDVF